MLRTLLTGSVLALVLAASCSDGLPGSCPPLTPNCGSGEITPQSSDPSLFDDAGTDAGPTSGRDGGAP